MKKSTNELFFEAEEKLEQFCALYLEIRDNQEFLIALLLHKGKRVLAIKMVRAVQNVSLKEAKEKVDRFQELLPLCF